MPARSKVRIACSWPRTCSRSLRCSAIRPANAVSTSNRWRDMDLYVLPRIGCLVALPPLAAGLATRVLGALRRMGHQGGILFLIGGRRLQFSDHRPHQPLASAAGHVLYQFLVEHRSKRLST